MPPIDSLSNNRMVRCFNLAEASKYKPNLIVLDRKELEKNDHGSRNIKLEVAEISAGYKTLRRFKDSSQTDAVKAVSFTVSSGDCVAIVGESGSGKTTTLRCIAGLHQPRNGIIRFENEIVENKSKSRSLEMRRRIQMVPQNPDSSLNPYTSVGDIIKRPIDLYFKLSPQQSAAKIEELLDRVHLKSNILQRYSRELSGGEKQRVAIARALAAEPELLLCDEVVSSLDVAVQAGILELLQELRIKMGMTIVFVSHDLGVVRSIASKVVVMKDGVIVESGSTHQIFESAQDQYTLELLKAIPNLGKFDYPGEPQN
jgi:peptide/nickel transport system ATP-binding protein